VGTANKITPELQDYILGVGVREHPVLARCREETRRDFPDHVEMQIAPEQGAFLALLVRLLDARRALEVGVFTGYSGLAVALALPLDGQLVACELDRRYARRARRYWKDAGVGDRVDLRLGPALKTLDSLIAQGGAGSFDLAFIDADKTGYDDYYEAGLTLLRPGGIVAFDNTLWGGSVIDAADQSDATVAIRELNEKLSLDDRVDLALTTIGDGLTLARKR
jgi:predicted O-methyltransferase YrrM